MFSTFYFVFNIREIPENTKRCIFFWKKNGLSPWNAHTQAWNAGSLASKSMLIMCYTDVQRVSLSLPKLLQQGSPLALQSGLSVGASAPALALCIAHEGPISCSRLRAYSEENAMCFLGSLFTSQFSPGIYRKTF